MENQFYIHEIRGKNNEIANKGIVAFLSDLFLQCEKALFQPPRRQARPLRWTAQIPSRGRQDRGRWDILELFQQTFYIPASFP